MTRRGGEPGFRPVQRTEFFLDDSDSSSATLYLPTLTVETQYRLTLSAYVTGTGGTRKVDFVSAQPITVPAGAEGAPYALQLAAATP
jgi:hypothetical protein